MPAGGYGAVVHRAEQVRPHIVVDPARQERPVDRIDLAARGFLKIHHAKSLFRIVYDFGDLGHPLREYTDSAEGGDVIYFRCAASSFSRA
jgi:hypothetical protein